MRPLRFALPVALLAALAAFGGSAREARADRRNPFDPFRSGAPATQPVRLLAAASQPAPSSQPVRLLAAASQPAPSSQPAARTPARAATGEAAACASDAECRQGTICEAETCRPIQFRLNVLYLYYRSPGRTFTEAAGLYWHQQGRSGYRVVAPFYWHFWTPSSKVRGLAPIYWRAVDHKAHTETTVVPPVQVGSAPGEKYFRIWPFAFYSDYGKAGSSFSLVPLVHFARRGSYTAGALFPIGFYARDSAKKTSTTDVLLYYRHRSPGWRSDALWPLFYAGRGERSAFAWAAPLNFYWRSGQQKRFLSIPFGFYRGDRRGSLAVIPAPPIVYYRKGDYTFTTAFPLYWRFGTPRSKETVVLPLVFAGHKGDSKHAVVFPLFWHFSRPGARTTILAPLAYFGADRKLGTSHATVLPFFHYSTASFGRKAFLLTPLGVHETDRDNHTSYTFLFAPPYYRRRDPEREVDALIPLYLRYKNLETGTTVRAITPLLWLRSDPTGSTQVLFPAVWRFTDARRQISATVVPPVFYHRTAPGSSTTVLGTAFVRTSARKWSAGLAPLLFVGGGQDGRHAVVFPFFWHFSGGGASTTVAGPIYDRRDARGWAAGIAPVVMAGDRDGERHLVVFPLVWHFASERDGTSATVVGPAFGGKTRRGWRAGLAPVFFFGRDGARSHQVVAPLFWRFFDAKRDDETVVVGPGFRRLVGGHSAAGPTRSEYGLLPLFHYRRTTAPRDTVSLTIVPLLHHSRTPRRELWVTPLGGFSKTRSTETLVVGPYVHRRTRDLDGHFVAPLFGHWHDRRDGSTTDLLAPLAVYHRSPARSAAVVFPFLWYFREQQETALTVFPLYSRVRSAGMNADVAFPLVWSFRSPQRRTLVVGPGFHSRGLKPDSLTAGVVPLFAYSRNPTRRVFASLPFVYLKWWEKEKRSLQVVGPFWRATYPDGYNAGLFPLGFIRDRGPRRQALLFPLVWHSSDSQSDSHRNVVLPFYYHREGKERTYGLMPVLWLKTKPTGAAFTVFPAFHVASDAEKVRVLTAAFGVQVGRGTQPSWGYVGPIWWLRKSNWSADGVFPLAWRFHDKERQRHTFMLAPFWYSRVAPDSAYYAFAPFVFRSRTVSSATTVVFPFVYDVNHYYQQRTTVVFPLGWRHYSAEDNSTTWGVLPTVMVRSKPDGTDAFVFPLVWHWGGEQRSTTVVAPLFWDFKRGTDRTTILVPLVWRFKRADADTWVVLNTYYRKGLGKHAGTYRFVFVPLFEVARPRPGDLQWEVLSGLFGYARIGQHRIMKLFWQNVWLTPQPPATPPRQEPGSSATVSRPKPKPQPKGK